MVPPDIPAARVRANRAPGELARSPESVTLFDIYGETRYARATVTLAFALRRAPPTHTLTAQEIRGRRKQVVTKAAKVLGASLRA